MRRAWVVLALLSLPASGQQERAKPGDTAVPVVKKGHDVNAELASCRADLLRAEMKLGVLKEDLARCTAQPKKVSEAVEPHGRYRVECAGQCGNGGAGWVEYTDNLITTVGKNDTLTQYFTGSSYTATWYLALISSTGYTTGCAAGDTSASHPGWTEATESPGNKPWYSQPTRPAVVFGTAAAGSISNSASPASYTIAASGDGTAKGIALFSVAAKGGTTGVIYSCAPFTGGDRGLQAGDTLQITYTASQ